MSNHSFDSEETIIEEEEDDFEDADSVYLGNFDFERQSEQTTVKPKADTSKVAPPNRPIKPRAKANSHFHADNSQYGFSKDASIAGQPLDMAKVILSQVCNLSMFSPCFKVTIFGSGKCAGALAFLLLSNGVTGEIVLYDVPASYNNLTALTMDLIAASPYYPLHAKIISSHDLADTDNSKVYVYTSDLRGMANSGGSYIDSNLTNSNVALMKDSLEYLKKAASENSIILNYAKSGDLMEYAIWKYTNFEPHRIVGVGTNTSAAYFRNYMARKFKCSESDCVVAMSGMEGTNLVPIWTSIFMCGTRLMDANPAIATEEGDEWTDAVQKSSIIDNVIREKKQSNTSRWGAAVIMCSMINAIINNTREMFMASTYIASCRHGSSDGVFMSLPCILGSNGVSHLIKEVMTEEEQDKMADSAEMVLEKIKQLVLPAEVVEPEAPSARPEKEEEEVEPVEKLNL